MYPYELLHRMYPEEINRLLNEAQMAINSNNVLLNENNLMLFTDSCGSVTEQLVLETTANGKLRFRGKFQEANAVNKNNRMYTFEALQANVDRLSETIKERGLIGELDHPTDSIIHFEKASHLITKLWFENNVLMGEAEILPTPAGRILENIIQAGVRVGISSRGVGNGAVNNEGVLVIGESFKLITFDAVADPSTFSAYQKVVVNNQRESIAPRQIIENPAEDNKSFNKFETARINKSINSNAVLAYFEYMMNNHTQIIKQNKF